MSAQTSTIRVDLAGRGYDIAIGPGLIDRAGELSRPLLAAPRVIIVSDETVAPLYGARLAASFDKAGVRTTSLTVPSGESSKEFGAFGRLMNELLDRRPDRKTTLVALGGGVVGDLAGFAAAVLLRGVGPSCQPDEQLDPGEMRYGPTQGECRETAQANAGRH